MSKNINKQSITEMHLEIHLFQNIRKLRNTIVNNPWVRKKSQEILENTFNLTNIKIQYIKIHGIQLNARHRRKT